MRAAELAEDFPVVSVDSDALDATRLLAEHRLPGIVVTDASGKPFAVLPASQVVRFIVPRYVQDDPSLAGVLNESVADRCAEKLRGKTVRDVLPDHLVDVPPVDADDTYHRGGRAHGAAAQPARRGGQGRPADRGDHRIAGARGGAAALNRVGHR